MVSTIAFPLSQQARTTGFTPTAAATAAAAQQQQQQQVLLLTNGFRGQNSQQPQQQQHPNPLHLLPVLTVASGSGEQRAFNAGMISQQNQGERRPSAFQVKEE